MFRIREAVRKYPRDSKVIVFFNDWDTLVKKTPVKSDYVLLEICSNPRKRTRSFFLDISCRPGGLKNTP